ncbi:MAG: peptidoglycan DD-metalloendopeptidase family protein [Oscillospiraceae bacterium]|nr:peptidoglycan DD-metalloendopeptidase family protein [Oscillospiraceae bacterium]
MNNKKQGGPQGFLNFMAGKGFYAVLFLCLAAIGASGYMLFFRGENPSGTDGLTLSNIPTPSPASAFGQPSLAPAKPTPADEAASRQLETPAPQALSGPEDIIVDEQDPGPDMGVAAPAEIPDSKPKASPKPKATPVPQKKENPQAGFFWPVMGAISREYTGTKMVFNSNMQDFRTHSGIDIEAVPDTNVLASAPGNVTEVLQDRQYGTMVVIDHHNGYVTRYGNLQHPANAAEGQWVNPGDVIGAIGETSLLNTSGSGHLHFEIIKNGKQKNPVKLLPKS